MIGSITLARVPDEVKTFKKGVLKLVLKKIRETETKKIEIKSG